MIKKIWRVFKIIVIALAALYFFVTVAVIPLLSPWLIKNQGSKILRVPVSVRGVYFNPLFWSLHVVEFEVRNQSQNKLIGFDRLQVDLSFKDLLKKVIHVELVQIDRLYVHASLMENGQIDLMQLIPAQESTPKTPQKTAEPSATPVIKVDKIYLNGGTIQFEDRMLQPVFKTVLNNIELQIKDFSTLPESITSVDFKAVLDEKGLMSAQAQLKALKDPIELEMTFALDQYTLPVMSPYVGKYTGRLLSDGKLDFNTTYRISDNKLHASHKILIQRFTFGDKVESKDALKLPFGLALALLEDSEGRITITLPVDGNLNDPEFHYTHLIWQTARNFFMKLITKPFSMLGSLAGLSGDSGTDELAYVRFPPGKADLTAEEEKKLLLLTSALANRPKLLIEVNGSYDRSSDWKAIKTDQFNRDYEALKKESTKDENGILQTLYQRRFGIRQLWKLTKSFKGPHGYDFEKLNAEIKRQLAQEAFPDMAALHALAQSRAQNIQTFLLKEHLDPRRVSLGPDHEAQASMGFVPLEFTLTVFE